MLVLAELLCSSGKLGEAHLHRGLMDWILHLYSKIQASMQVFSQFYYRSATFAFCPSDQI